MESTDDQHAVSKPPDKSHTLPNQDATQVREEN